MIITCPFELEVNKVYTEKELPTRFEMFGKYYYKFRFFVLRITTLEEYRKYVEKIYSNPDEIGNHEFFYEISMD
jgi:hypothetical protein